MSSEQFPCSPQPTHWRLLPCPLSRHIPAKPGHCRLLREVNILVPANLVVLDSTCYPNVGPYHRPHGSVPVNACTLHARRIRKLNVTALRIRRACPRAPLSHQRSSR